MEMDWKSVGIVAGGISATGVAVLHFVGKWLELRDVRWRARAIAAEKSNAELQEIIRGLQSENAALQKQLEDLKARPSAETLASTDIPPGSGFVTGF